MIGTSAYVFEVDPDKKTPDWANKVISIHRMYWRRLANVQRLWNDRLTMFSMQELSQIRESFQDENFKKNVQFLPLPILETFVNAIVEELTKNPPRTEVRATDPTAINEKKQDLEKLRNRRIIQRDITQLNQQIKLPPYKLNPKNFKGNIEEFDKMGLDERDPEDINFYEEHYQRLLVEIAAQSILDNITKVNQFDEVTLRKLVKDIFAVKVACTQAYVDQISGQIKWKYIDPSVARGIFGITNDGKNDVCRGWEDSITVQEMLEFVGNEFDWDRDWPHLLWAINYCNTTNFTGFIRDSITYDCCALGDEWTSKMGLDGAEANFLDFTNAYMYKVWMGYIEWSSPEATLTYVTHPDNPTYVDYVPYSYQLKDKKIKEGYQKDSSYQRPWYCSYFIATSSISQWLYRYQKVYFQTLEGAYDEYSNGTICYFQEEGKSATEIAKPYLQPAHYAFYHMLWLIYKSKPDEDEYLLEEMITLSKALVKQFPQMAGNGGTPSFQDVLMQVVSYNRKNHIRIRTYPEVNGQKVTQLPNEKRRGTQGLDPLAIAMQSVTQWAEMQIAQKIGINPMRLGANPPSRESTTTEEATVQYSYNTTGYMYRMLLNIKQHLAIATLNYTVDILQYKESVPYKYLLTMVGNEAIDNMGVLEKTCMHRYGIFITDYNRNFERQRVLQAADLALQKGTLTVDQWAVIIMTDDPKKGFAILSRMERIKKKQERDMELAQMQMQDVYAQRQHDRIMEEKTFERETMIMKSDIESQAYIQAAKIQGDSRIAVKQMTNDAELPKQEAKAAAQENVLRTKSNLEEQTPTK